MTMPARSGDRWLEMDLTWFDSARPFGPQLDTLFGRVAPLLAEVRGRRGIFFNLGWLIDLVTEWTGDLDQPIPTRSRRTAPWAAVGYRRLAEFLAHYATPRCATASTEPAAGSCSSNGLTSCGHRS